MVTDEKLLVIGQRNGFSARVLHEYTQREWSYHDATLDKVTVQRTIEYIAGPQRIKFFNELYRCLKIDGTATLYLPYWSSPNSVADPFLQWPPVTELSIYYLASKEFRERNVPEYNDQIHTNFDVNYGYSYNPNYHVRSDQARQWAVEHSLSIVTEVVFTLTRKEW